MQKSAPVGTPLVGVQCERTPTRGVPTTFARSLLHRFLFPISQLFVQLLRIISRQKETGRMEQEQTKQAERTPEEEDAWADEQAALAAGGEVHFEGWFGSNYGGALW